MLEKIETQAPKEDLSYPGNPFQIRVINNGEAPCELQLRLKPFATENLNDNWYSLSEEFVTIKGKGNAELTVTITASPLLNNSSDTDYLVPLQLIIREKSSQKEKFDRALNLKVTPIKKEVSFLETVEKVEALSNLKPEVEKLKILTQTQESEIQSLKQQIDSVNIELKTQQLAKEKLEELNNLTQTQESEIKSLKQQLNCLYQKTENRGDAYFEVANYENAIAFYELAINLGSPTAEGKLKETKNKTQENLYLGNGVILELVKIPAGSFKMGGDHEINLKGFLLGKYPVTQKQWQQVMGNNPSKWKGDNLPVEQVNWNFAVEFCQKLKAKTGRQVMLPSEAQWEYAARAGTKENYFFGNKDDQLGEYAWYDKNSGGQTHPVGEKKPNPFGLYDILGLVWEWCQDGWVDDYHQLPRSGSALENNNNTKLLRGGSWDNSPGICQCGYRYRYNADHRDWSLGFRLLVAPSTL